MPNNDICPARRFRIHKAIQHGAVWANEWYDDVTHIVVCENLDVEEASKELGCIKFLVGASRVPKSNIRELTVSYRAAQSWSM